MRFPPHVMDAHMLLDALCSPAACPPCFPFRAHATAGVRIESCGLPAPWFQSQHVSRHVWMTAPHAHVGLTGFLDAHMRFPFPAVEFGMRATGAKRGTQKLVMLHTLLR